MSGASGRPTRSLRPRHCNNCADDRPPRPSKKASTKRTKVNTVPVVEKQHSYGGHGSHTANKPVTQQLEVQHVDENEEMVTLILIPIDQATLGEQCVQVYEEQSNDNSCTVRRHASIEPYNRDSCEFLQWPARIDLDEGNFPADIDLRDNMSDEYNSTLEYDSDHSFTLQIDEDSASPVESEVVMDINKPHKDMVSVPITEIFGKSAQLIAAENLQKKKLFRKRVTKNANVKNNIYCNEHVNEDCHVHDQRSLVEVEGSNVEDEESIQNKMKEGENGISEGKDEVNGHDKQEESYEKVESSVELQEGRQGCVDDEENDIQHTEHHTEHIDKVKGVNVKIVELEVHEKASVLDDVDRDGSLLNTEEENRGTKEGEAKNCSLRQDDNGHDLSDHDGDGQSSVEDEEGRDGFVEDEEDNNHQMEDGENYIDSVQGNTRDVGVCNEEESEVEDNHDADDNAQEGDSEGYSEDDSEDSSSDSNSENSDEDDHDEGATENHCTNTQDVEENFENEDVLPDTNKTQHSNIGTISSESSSGLTPQKANRNQRFTMAENVLLCRMVCAQYSTLMKRDKHYRARQRKDEDWVNIAEKVSEVKRKPRTGLTCRRHFQDCRRQVKEMMKEESDGEEVYYNHWQKLVKSTVIAYPRIGRRIVKNPYKRRKIQDVQKQRTTQNNMPDKEPYPQQQHRTVQKETSTSNFGKDTTTYREDDFVCSPAQHDQDTEDQLNDMDNNEHVVEPNRQTTNENMSTDSSIRHQVPLSKIDDRRQVPDLVHAKQRKQTKFIGTAELNQDEEGCFTNCTVFVSPQKQKKVSSRSQVVPFKPNEHCYNEENSFFESRQHIVSRCSQPHTNSDLENDTESNCSVVDLVSPNFSVTLGIADNWSLHETFELSHANSTPKKNPITTVQKNYPEQSDSITAVQKNRSDSTEIDLTRKFLEIQHSTLQLLTTMSDGQKQMLDNQKGMLAEIKAMNQKKKKKHRRKYRKHYSSDSQS